MCYKRRLLRICSAFFLKFLVPFFIVNPLIELNFKPETPIQPVSLLSDFPKDLMKSL